MASSKKEINRRFRQKRIEQGLCVTCGKTMDRETGQICSECRRKKSEEDQKTRQMRLKYGLCPRCGINKLFGEEKECLECKNKGYEIAMKSREKLGTDHYNQVHREWAKKEHQRRIEAGICTRCGKRKSDAGMKTCGICRSKSNEKRRIKSPEKMKQSDRYLIGLCYFCDNPVKSGYKVCEKHYQMNMDNLNSSKCKEAIEKIKRDNKKYFI